MTVKAPAIIAVSVDELKQFGCPHCGYRSGSMPLSGGWSAVWTCGDAECSQTCCVLADGVARSSIGFGEENFRPELQAHPRRGIPAHGRPDKRPEGGGEFFRSRGVGLDNCFCFVCPPTSAEKSKRFGPMMNNIAAYVRGKEAGERVVKMFGHGAWLDYRERSPDYVQVKIGACDRHRRRLEKFHELTQDGIITDERIAQARAFTG